jgi:hypothetical protein
MSVEPVNGSMNRYAYRSSGIGDAVGVTETLGVGVFVGVVLGVKLMVGVTLGVILGVGVLLGVTLGLTIGVSPEHSPMVTKLSSKSGQVEVHGYLPLKIQSPPKLYDRHHLSPSWKILPPPPLIRS